MAWKQILLRRSILYIIFELSFSILNSMNNLVDIHYIPTFSGSAGDSDLEMWTLKVMRKSQTSPT